MPAESLPRTWDAIVVGAGVAGCAAATNLARGGARVLLVEKAGWPRDKVCGGCLNAAAVRRLQARGLGHVLETGRPYARMRLAAARREVVFPLPAGRAITRRRLDAGLAAAAVGAGASFLPATRATLGPATVTGRDVTLCSASRTAAVRAAVVLDCCGLADRLARDGTLGEAEVMPGAPIGIGAGVRGASADYYPGAIHMACGERGYVGLVRSEDDALNIGAALDPAWLKRIGGPAPAVEAILGEAGFPVFPALRKARWWGTPRLTRCRRRLGAERLLVLGDAAGYVEPFTGEGMAWALADADAVVPLACAAMDHWDAELVADWSARHTAMLRARRRVCRAVTRSVRHPRWLAPGLTLAAAAPALLAPLTAWLNRDLRPCTAAGK